MRTEDQSAVMAYLASPDAHAGAPVTVIETHASVVFVAAAHAWKLKRAVRYEYLDFSSADRRRAMCEAEVRVNRRTAPFLYRGVLAVTRAADGALAVDRGGTPVDWLVDMVRFDEDAVLDRLAARSALDLAVMAPLGGTIARFHRDAAARVDHGGAAGLRWVIDGNAVGFDREGTGSLDPVLCWTLTETTLKALDQRADHLDRRRREGSVRECHGDLHLRNLVLLDGQPTLFDGIEFNDEIACVDVLYDLSFLLMDLWRRRLSDHANAVLNGYLAVTRDFEGLDLLPLFLSCRAAVRAKTSATAATLQNHGEQRAGLTTLARDYLAMARAFLEPRAGMLVAIGGLSGSGKSTLARSLASSIGPAPGAVVLRSDEVRKSLCGVPPLVHLDATGYRPEVTERVYATLAEMGVRIAGTGHGVVIDAVCAEAAARDIIAAAARRAGVPFVGIWLDAPEPVLVARVQTRTGDVSDADASVVRQQLAKPTGTINWHRVDAAAGHEAVLAVARSFLA